MDGPYAIIQVYLCYSRLSSYELTVSLSEELAGWVSVKSHDNYKPNDLLLCHNLVHVYKIGVNRHKHPKLHGVLKKTTDQKSRHDRLNRHLKYKQQSSIIKV